MRAAVLREYGKPLVVEDVEIDAPKENEVLVRIAASGICHSDYSVAHGVLRTPFPCVLGHEGAGVIEEVGPGVVDLSPGDHVIAALTPSCGTCPMCVEGSESLCMQTVQTMGRGLMVDGTNRLHQGSVPVHQLCGIASFAERAVIPAGAAIRVPLDVPLETVCLIGCGVMTGVGAAINTAAIKPETSVAVLGCGGVGLSIIQGARIAGASTIIAVDLVKEKRELAQSLGATHALDPRAGDLARAVRAIAPMGVHYAFEAIGRTDTIEQMWSLLRPNGSAILVGMPSVRDEIKLGVGGFFAQRSIKGSAYGSARPKRDIPKLVDLYRSGELQLDPMITSRIGLEDINVAFEAMSRGEGARSVIVFDA